MMKHIVEFYPIRARTAQSVHDFLAVRGKDGAYQKNLQYAVRSFRREPTAVHLRVFGVHLLRLLVGDRLMNALLSDRAVVITREYNAKERLYHFAPTEIENRILCSGLCPKDRYVYLTDAPQLYEQSFLQWKTAQIGRTTAYTLFEIDTAALSKEQKIFCTDREHEYVTERIDARYICIPKDCE